MSAKLRVLITAPGERGSRTGNQVTAQRWARMLRRLDCWVTVSQSVSTAKDLPAGDHDALIALHAKKSGQVVQHYHRRHPTRPILLAMTGTDFPELGRSLQARRSVELADFLILLQPTAVVQLPAEVRARARVIIQSAEPIKPGRRLKGRFEVCVVGHLRQVKDPFRAAYAVRQLPNSSNLCITHLGGALSPSMRERAEREMERNPRYRWLGNRPRWQARRLIARCRLLILTSRSEGGPSVISEALMSDVPVICSRIPAGIGLLGDDYPGFFEVGNTSDLRDIMLRCEQDAAFDAKLRGACERRKPFFRPHHEQQAWCKLIDEVKSIRWPAA